jgi:hypothetical protein
LHSNNRVRTKLESPWIWKEKFKALSVLEFVKKVLVSPWIFLALISFWIFSEIVWHSKRTLCWIDFACMFISDKAVWNSLKLRFEEFNVRFYSFLTTFLQYLVLEFADTWPWLFLSCTSPVIKIRVLAFEWLLFSVISSKNDQIWADWKLPVEFAFFHLRAILKQCRTKEKLINL